MSTSNKSRNQLVKLLTNISEPELMNAALETILTPKELEGVENRLLIFQMLKKKIPQREIASRLNVGIATVTRGAMAFRNSKFFELDLENTEDN